jgi:hypothetical protein
MARNTSFIPYDEPFASDDPFAHGEQAARAFEEEPDSPGYPQYMAYESARSMARDNHPLPEDRMPLFLSNDADEPRQRGFGTGGDRIEDNAVVRPRIFRAAIFVVSAAAIAFAIVAVGNPLALFTDAKASLPSAAADESSAAPKSDPPPQVQLADTSAPTPVLPATTAVRAAPAAPKVTRDDIALALRAAAQQNQMQADQPPAPPQAAIAPPARRLAADEVEALLKRAKTLIAIGDIAPARLLLERAADAQEAGAALLLAQTYDPAVLGTPDMRSITPDPALARDWYQKAARLGSMDARQRLAQMQN